ncbi:tyrosine-type recombinase/integrase [Nonomuraea sp. 3-1Str]|uniref:tyrosine-type recombinase/integrase n=1 Tax=Nonomuraea sp. 3-1Str TaxID=2929801 RepID=UPI0037C5FFA8
MPSTSTRARSACSASLWRSTGTSASSHTRSREPVAVRFHFPASPSTCSPRTGTPSGPASSAQWCHRAAIASTPGPTRPAPSRPSTSRPRRRRSPTSPSTRAKGDLRHRYATWLVSEGVPVNDVAGLIGHEQISTTLNRYTRVTRPQQQGSGCVRRRRHPLISTTDHPHLG